MTLSECQEKQEVRLYAPFNRHWESNPRVQSPSSTPLIPRVNQWLTAFTSIDIDIATNL
jgi:hypothetical protein